MVAAINQVQWRDWSWPHHDRAVEMRAEESWRWLKTWSKASVYSAA